MKNQLTLPEDAQPPSTVVHADAGSIMEVISRAAADPATDVDKLERLLGMYERITARSAKAAYSDALASMQQELPIITERGGIRDKNGRVQSTYARWEDINQAVKPVLAAHGFALSFRIGEAENGRPTVTGVLSHRGGHSEETTMALPVDQSGSKNAVQAVGSSVSYGKRYTALALLNLTSRMPGEADDDGRAAGGTGELISDSQVKNLLALAEDVGADIPRFCRFMKIPSIPDLFTERYDEAVAALEGKRRT